MQTLKPATTCLTTINTHRRVALTFRRVRASLRSGRHSAITESEPANQVILDCVFWHASRRDDGATGMRDYLPEVDARVVERVGSVHAQVYGFGLEHDVIEVRGYGPVAEELAGLQQNSRIRVVGRLGAPRALAPNAAAPRPYIVATQVQLLRDILPAAAAAASTPATWRASDCPGGGAVGPGAVATGANCQVGCSPPRGQQQQQQPQGAQQLSREARRQAEAANWEALRANPDEWYDNRLIKRNEKAPDFKRKDGSAALWLTSYGGQPQWLASWLASRPAAAAAPAGGSGSAKRAAELALWEALQDKPDEWYDNRTRKTNPKAPDFKRKDGSAALWLTSYSAPTWAHDL